ncbi:unnamed protein product [Cochlearia groenlandica]
MVGERDVLGIAKEEELLSGLDHREKDGAPTHIKLVSEQGLRSKKKNIMPPKKNEITQEEKTEILVREVIAIQKTISRINSLEEGINEIRVEMQKQSKQMD